MRLNGRQIAQIRDALLDAFDKHTLREVVRVELDEVLEHVADGENLRIVAFNLVTWAEQNNRIEALIQAAHNANRDNNTLSHLWRDSRLWPTAQPPPPPPAAPAALAPAALAPAALAGINIFLSYNHHDQAAMHAVRAVLCSHNFSVWTDEGLEPGAPDWVAAIQGAIEQAQAVVVLLSPAAKASLWLNREIAYAEARRKPIFPLLVAGDAGDATPISLITAQWIDGREDVSAAAQRLPAVLPPSPPPSPPAGAPAGAPPAALDKRGPAHDRSLPATLEGHTNAVLSVAWSPDGRTLASGGVDRTLRLWNPHTGEPLAALAGHTGLIRSVAWSPDGQTLASGSLDRTLRLWNPHTGELLTTLEGHTNAVLSVAWSPDGSTLAGGSRDGSVRLWNPHTGESRALPHNHTDSVWSVAWGAHNNLLASSSYDCTVRLWDVRTGEQVRQWADNLAVSLAWSPDGNLLAGSGEEGVWLWDMRTGKRLAALHGERLKFCYSIAFSPDARFLAGSMGSSVVLWDMRTGSALRKLPGLLSSVWSVAWSPAGNILAGGSAGNSVRLWPVHLLAA